MIKGYCKQSIHMGIIFAGFLGLFTTGCAVGVTKVKVAHDPLGHTESKREGNILVREFTDTRKDTKHIGNKRNMFGMVLGHIGMKDEAKLETLLTVYFVEALKEAGYKAVLQNPQSSNPEGQVKFDAVVGGEITEFWLDLYMAVWHKVGVKVNVLDPASQNVLWENEIRGEETNTLWVGVASEFEKVIGQALTKALNQAVKEFSSEEFYKAVKGGQEKGTEIPRDVRS